MPRCLAGMAGTRVLWPRGDQAEADLDFGIVDQLTRPAAGAIPAAALTDEAGSAASSFAVGARLLEMLRELQATSAAIVIDDLQWADRESVEALTFMLRRLSVDPVVAIVIYRGPGGGLDETDRRQASQPARRTVVRSAPG